MFFYRTARGDSPVKEYIDNLSTDEKATVYAYIAELQEMGYLPYPKAKKLSGTRKLWEIRPGRQRVIFFYYQGDVVIFLHAFKKQSQKTAKKEIDTALYRMKLVEEGGR